MMFFEPSGSLLKGSDTAKVWAKSMHMTSSGNVRKNWERVGNWEDRYYCSWNSDKLIVKMSAFYRLPHEVFVSLQQD